MGMSSDLFVRPYPLLKEFILIGELLKDQRVIAGASLMKVYEHERDLNRGRFQNFTQHETHEHHVRVPGHMHITEPMVNWIAEQVDTPWGLTVVDQAETGVLLDFSFTDIQSAVYFKLVFA